MISETNQCQYEVGIATFTKPTFSVSILVAEKLIHWLLIFYSSHRIEIETVMYIYVK